MGNRVNVIQLHHPVGNEPERPSPISGRRLGAGDGDDVGLDVPVDLCVFCQAKILDLITRESRV